jgi:hypothetical protein
MGKLGRIFTVIVLLILGSLPVQAAEKPNIRELTSIMSKQGFRPEGPKWVQNNKIVSGVNYVKREGDYIEMVVVKILYNKQYHVGPIYRVSFLSGKIIHVKQEDGSIFKDEVLRTTPYEYSWKNLKQLRKDLKNFLDVSRKLIEVDPQGTQEICGLRVIV